MKIETIIIENINSIEKAEISFSTGVLANEPLFLITGETGSGKSTILDAITLALYDKSPRYENTMNKEKTEDGQTTVQSTTNVLRKGTTDCKAEVWFTIGSERYVATWQMHKTRNGKYDMTNRRKLEVVNGDERIVLETKIDAVNQQITELVGLTYDQFVRSVMLAQGQFNTFLTSEKAKQTEILEMLTGTEIYSKIAEIVGKRKNEAKTAAEQAGDTYKMLKDNVKTESELTELNENLTKNTEQYEQNEADIKKLEHDLQNLENLKKLYQEIDNSKSQLADLLASYEKMLDDRSALKNTSDDIRKHIDEQSVKKPMFEQITLIISILQEIEYYEKKISDCNKEIESLNSQKTLKESESSDLANKLLEASEKQKEATWAYENCNEKFAKANLNGLMEDYNIHKTELAHQEERKTTCLRVNQILKEYKSKQHFIDTKCKELCKLKYNFKEFESVFSAKKTLFEAKDAEYLMQKNMVDDYMKSLRSKLKDGEPCPLCGSTSHQYHDEVVVGSLFRTVETAWKEARNEFDKAKDAINKADSNIKLATQSIDNESQQLTNLNNELINLCNGNPIYDLEKLEKGQNACESKISAEALIIKDINEKIKEAQEIQKKLQLLLVEKNNADIILKSIENQCVKVKNEINEIEGKLKNRRELIEQTEHSRLEKLERANQLIIIEEWENKWRKNSADFYLILRSDFEKWKKLNDDLAKVDTEIVKIDEIDNEIRRIEGMGRVDEFKGKIAARNNIDRNNLISGFSKVMFSLIDDTKEVKNIEIKLGNDTVRDLNGHETKLKELLDKKMAIKQTLADIIAEIRATLSLNVQTDAMAKTAKDDFEKKTAFHALWTELADAIGTTNKSNFRDVAQAYTMRILLDQANYFLRKLSQRYELTCYTNSLAIMVMDKEMGGELRSASSLSGGETFLVSLALALGLTSLNDENLNIDMLFIDEGFGSLDGESLEMAVQTLENMQKFGKKVGIISHVESLKDRIPAQIQVTKRGRASSEVVIK